MIEAAHAGAGASRRQAWKKREFPRRINRPVLDSHDAVICFQFFSGPRRDQQAQEWLLATAPLKTGVVAALYLSSQNIRFDREQESSAFSVDRRWWAESCK